MSRVLCARWAMDSSASVERMARSSARSSGSSETPPEQMASFRSGRAWPERISSRSSELMGRSRGGLEVVVGERDAAGLAGDADGSDGLAVEFEEDCARVGRGDGESVLRVEVEDGAGFDVRVVNAAAVGEDFEVGGLAGFHFERERGGGGGERRGRRRWAGIVRHGHWEAGSSAAVVLRRRRRRRRRGRR